MSFRTRKYLFLFLFFFVLVALAVTVSADDTGWQDVGTEANSGSGSSWSNLGNAGSDDFSYTECVDTGSGDISKYLKCTNFGLSVTSGASIDGVEARVLWSDANRNIYEYHIYLVKGGTIQTGWTDKGDGTNLPNSLSAYTTFGGSSDLWGGTLSESDIDSDFGVAFQVNEINFREKAQVDHVQIKVYYSASNSAPTQTNASPNGSSIHTVDNFTVDLNDADDDPLEWEMWTNYSGSWNMFDNGTGNGTQTSTNTSWLPCEGTVYWSVNVTDGTNWTNTTYSFTLTNDPPWVHNPSHTGQVYETDFTWEIDINDNQSDLFSGSIECSTGDNTSGDDENNGTFSVDIHLSGCDENITIWVNVTDGCENTNETYFLEYINNPPEFSNLDPFDGETDVALPGCSITLNITDPEGDTFSYDWACSDGSYNSAIGNTNGTKYLMLCMEGIHTCGTTYTWWINASDGCEYTNNSYSFTTRDCEGEYSDIHPSNASSEVCPCVSCDNYTCVCINASHESGKNVNISFYSNYSGTWTMFENYINVSGRYCAFFPVDYNTTYYWYVNVSEYGNDSSYNQTDVYSFTTALNVSNCTCSIGETDIETLILDFIDTNGMYLIPLILFILFFCVGYLSDKRSAGAFLLVSGLLFLIFSILVFSIEPTISVLCVVTAIFISLIGINKWLIKPNLADESQRES